MDSIKRVLSRPNNKPYRTHQLAHSRPDYYTNPYLNSQGLVDFHPDNDPENPKTWSTMRRWSVTVASVFLVVNATMASSMPSGAFNSIADEFSVSIEAAGLTVTLFLLGYCAGPLVFAPLSEFYGRRWIFYITFAAYIALTFLCAFAPNFGALLVGRFLTGTFISAPLSNAPGVLADVWNPVERGNAMAVFSCMVYVGPALGPVIGGFLELTKDWRWCFYVLLMLGGATSFIMLTIPETYAPYILLLRAQRIRAAGAFPGSADVKAPIEVAENRSMVAVYKVALTRPWVILFDPISFLSAVYLSVVYTLLYMLFTIYPIVFQERRGWNSGVGELPLIGSVVGAVLGAVVVWFDSAYQVKKIERGVKLTPEDRLPMTILGGVLFPITMFWFAWTAEFDSIHWVVPTLAGVFLSAALLLIFVGFLNYLVDTYIMFAASAIAANTVARSACGAVAPLFTNYMFNALGVGGGGSLVGGVATILALVPIAFYKYGEKIRIKSKFAPTQAQDSAQEELEKKPRDEEEGGQPGVLAESTDEDIVSSRTTVAGDDDNAISGAPGAGHVNHDIK